MKKTLFIIICLSMPYCIMAQDTVKQREVGVVFCDLDNFGLTYKTGTATSLWRFQSMVLLGKKIKDTGDSHYNTSSEFGSELQFGKEFRTLITEKLNFRYGADLSISYRQSKSEINYINSNFRDSKNEKIEYGSGLNFVLGFNYALTENVILGAELQPHFTYTTGTLTEQTPFFGIDYEGRTDETTSDISEYSYGMNNHSALLTLAYMF